MSNIYTTEELNQRKPKAPSQELIQRLYNKLNQKEELTQADITELQEIANFYYLIYSIDYISGNLIIYQAQNYGVYNKCLKDIERIKGLDKKSTYEELKKIIQELKEFKNEFLQDATRHNTFTCSQLKNLCKKIDMLN